MTPERLRQVEELFHAARERAPEYRAELLDAADPEVRREVESLLAQRLDPLLDRPIPGPMPETTGARVSAGARLGPYQIEEVIGAGGMGEVHRALDTRLGRRVAIKVSGHQFSDRFEREARAIAALNHPHICILHDIGPNYLVMELLEGETLAARLRKGKLSIEQSIQFGIQIADALAAAHAKGIIHRDLKPGNIMLTKSGAKVLDFGLAKSVGDETLSASRVVMGTPAYMAPEQREGKPCDARTDIHALGLVLREMAGGKLDQLPPLLAHVLERCLMVEPNDRWQTASDVRSELEWAGRKDETSAPQRRKRAWWAVPVAALLLSAVLASWAVSHWRQPVLPQEPMRLELAAPENGRFGAGLALSPDGRTLAYVATTGTKSTLWLRSLDGLANRMLAGTEGATEPFWSPDGKSLGFFVSDTLFRLDTSGGAPVAIGSSGRGSPRGGSWAPEGRILVAGAPSALYQVPASGGRPAPLTTLDSSRSEVLHQWPQALPGGRFLYWARSNIPENTGIYVASYGKPQERVRLLRTDSQAIYTKDRRGRVYLVWSRNETLVAQEFDLESLQLKGEARSVVEGVAPGVFGDLPVTASTNGVLVYRPTVARRDQLTWLDRGGIPLGTIGEPDNLRDIILSPDDKRVAISRPAAGGRFDLWLLDAVSPSGTASRFTAGEGNNVDPMWSPDNRSLVYTRVPDLLLRREANGAASEQVIARSFAHTTDWSQDGRYLVYYTDGRETQRDLFVLAIDSGNTQPYLRTPSNELNARFSRERSPRWVAYQSDYSGRYEIYVQAFPQPRGKFLISTGGGRLPMWNPAQSGSKGELFYLSPENKLMAASLNISGDVVQPSRPRELFALERAYPSYQVSSDGKRFLVNAPVKAATQLLTVIINWPELRATSP
jgi:Tol biopolymer transport system component